MYFISFVFVLFCLHFGPIFCDSPVIVSRFDDIVEDPLNVIPDVDGMMSNFLENPSLENPIQNEVYMPVYNSLGKISPDIAADINLTTVGIM